MVGGEGEFGEHSSTQFYVEFKKKESITPTRALFRVKTELTGCTSVHKVLHNAN